MLCHHMKPCCIVCTGTFGVHVRGTHGQSSHHRGQWKAWVRMLAPTFNFSDPHFKFWTSSFLLCIICVKSGKILQGELIKIQLSEAEMCAKKKRPLKKPCWWCWLCWIVDSHVLWTFKSVGEPEWPCQWIRIGLIRSKWIVQDNLNQSELTSKWTKI